MESKHATYVVVDTHDGYTFWQGSDGVLFDAETARQFAGQRNAEMKPEHRMFQVFRLAPDVVHGVQYAGADLDWDDVLTSAGHLTYILGALADSRGDWATTPTTDLVTVLSQLDELDDSTRRLRSAVIEELTDEDSGRLA